MCNGYAWGRKIPERGEFLEWALEEVRTSIASCRCAARFDIEWVSIWAEMRCENSRHFEDVPRMKEIEITCSPRSK